MAEHPLAHLIGARFPGGTFTIGGYENGLAHDALYSEPDSRPHPIMAFIGAQQGMGMSVAELFAWLESHIEDGPLLASCELDLPRPLEVGTSYTVAGEIAAIDRKHGRSLGAFDLVRCVFRLRDGDGQVVASVTNTYAITRKGEQ